MNHEINFFNEHVNFRIHHKMILRKWICSTIEMEGSKVVNINFVLCDDEYLSVLNFKYLKHKTFTDILTFSLGGEDEMLLGDIFISMPRVKENARIYKQKVEIELHRVMIHGILHMIGYNDSSMEEKAQMKEREDFYLEKLKCFI